MNHFLKVLFVSLGLCHAEQFGLPATNTPLSELVRGAFINYWPLLNRPDLQHLRSAPLKAANFQDTDDCAKKLLCELSRKKDRTWDEDLVYTYYDQPVDYMSDSLFFNIAVQVGKDGERDCQDAYPSCFLKLPEMFKLIRRQGISFELPADDLDCQVYVVWRKKDRNYESSKAKQNPLISQEPATKDIFKTQSKFVLTHEDSGFAEDRVAAKNKNIETSRTKSESLLQQESEHEYRLVDYTIKSNSTDQQKETFLKNEFINLRSEKPIINQTESVDVYAKLTSYLDEFERETPELNRNNETETNINQNKSLLKEKALKNDQTKEIGGVTDQAPAIPESPRKKSNEHPNSNLEKESHATGDKDEVTNDTNIFREGALGGVIGGVLGGLFGMYRSFV